MYTDIYNIFGIQLPNKVRSNNKINWGKYFYIPHINIFVGQKNLTTDISDDKWDDLMNFYIQGGHARHTLVFDRNVLKRNLGVCDLGCIHIHVGENSRFFTIGVPTNMALYAHNCSLQKKVTK